MNINFSKQTCSLKKFVLFSLYVHFSTGGLDKVTIFVIKQTELAKSFVLDTSCAWNLIFSDIV